MEKLVEMIENFAEKAAVPAKDAAESIVRAHGYQCVGTLSLYVVFAALIVMAIWVGATLVLNNCKEKEDEPKLFVGLVFSMVGGVVLFIYLLALTGIPTHISCAFEPAGHLMKEYLLK